MSIEGEGGRGQGAGGSGTVTRSGHLLRPAPCALTPDRKRRYASAAFVTLLLLSVFWPSPIVSTNRLWLEQPLDVDELSFLGREAPQWDVVFWCIVGILLLAIIQSAEASDVRAPLRLLRGLRFSRPLVFRALGGLAVGAILTALVWRTVDQPMLAWAEGVQSEWLEGVIRIVNRFGGGMNPVLIVGFFVVAGIAYAVPRWVGYAVSMAVAGLGAGILAQIIKHLVGRARPELWLGPSHYAPGSSTSFPSGHTVGAFALAGVLFFGSRSWPLRIVAIVLAAAVGLSRVFAFRHWTSDVTASAAVGLAVSWLVTRAVIPLTSDSASRS